MVQKLEEIKGGGGSIKVGTVGIISSLMTRELGALSSSSYTPKSRKSVDEGSSSVTNSSLNKRNPYTDGNQHRVSVISAATPKRQKKKLAPLDTSGKTRNHKRSTDIPMLGSENIHLEKTPIREKHARKGRNLVHVVDIHCGNSTGLLSNRLKKLSFSKLSHSFI